MFFFFFFFSSRRRHTRSKRDWSSDVCSSDLKLVPDRKGNRVGIGKLRYRFVAALENRRLIGVDALEPVEEIARAHLAVDTKTHPVRKRAIRFEKNASVIIPDVSAFVGLFVVFVFGLLGGSARSHVQEK